jgi:hypothetical protein
MSTSPNPNASPPRTRWVSSNPGRSEADVFRLSADDREITLTFGKKTTTDPGTGETVLEVSDRVILGPATAERLLGILGHAVRDYEWKHGSLGGDPLPPAPQLKGPPAGRVVASLTEGIPAQAAELLRTIESLEVRPVLERSFKMSGGTLLPNRFLWGFKRDSLTEARAEKLWEICARLAMPPSLLKDFRAGVGDANVVFFGFEENARGWRYKAYLEFGDRLARVRAANPDAPEPVLIYLGFKWDANDPARSSVARYTCHPALSAPDMVERMRAAFYGPAAGPSFEIARAIVEQAAGRVGNERFLYFETTEDDNPRNSFDINLYNARLRVEDVYPLLLKACQHFGIASEAFLGAYLPVRAATFGHVTGGMDREGKDFLSIYFGAQ